jgi:hypothetical protein
VRASLNRPGSTQATCPSHAHVAPSQPRACVSIQQRVLCVPDSSSCYCFYVNTRQLNEPLMPDGKSMPQTLAFVAAFTQTHNN